MRSSGLGEREEGCKDCLVDGGCETVSPSLSSSVSPLVEPESSSPPCGGFGEPTIAGRQALRAGLDCTNHNV